MERFRRKIEEPQPKQTSEVVDDYAFALALQLLQLEEDEKRYYLHGDRTVSTSVFKKELSSRAIEFEDKQVVKSLLEKDQQSTSDRELALRLSGVTEDPLKQNQVNNSGECDSCKEEKLFLHNLPCKDHKFCHGCVKDLALHSLKDRSLIPLRCCQQSLPQELVKKVFTPDQWKKYSNFLAEVEMPHLKDEVDVDIQQTEASLNLKSCPKCARIIEKAHGCVHMTCLCRYEFCYNCLVEWHNCKCELFSRTELETILNERTNPNEGEAARMRLRGVLQNLYQHQHTWLNFHGKRQCSQCHWRTDIYYFYCQTCREARCRMCRFNR